MTQNSNINPSFQLGGNSYGHIRFQHYQYYQKLCSPHKKSEIRGFAGRATLEAQKIEVFVFFAPTPKIHENPHFVASRALIKNRLGESIGACMPNFISFGRLDWSGPWGWLKSTHHLIIGGHLYRDKFRDAKM